MDHNGEFINRLAGKYFDNKFIFFVFFAVCYV